ncbi:MAG: tRNA (cytidine(34)-2'-O)-methyltransferase [Alphaproteobacteria bacterium]|nr:tRNA (cytidine(34)-2'-O)-methyltransferase [Alphaproteobacteria bacterium]
MRLCLFQPDIAQNTGTLLRFGACLGVPVDIIGPAGFDLSDRALKRAGLDYLGDVELQQHVSFTAFDAWRKRRGARLVLATTKAELVYTDCEFQPADIVMVGRESSGVPDDVARLADQAVKIPMQQGMRSLNVALAAAMIMGEALRQVRTRESQGN